MLNLLLERINRNPSVTRMVMPIIRIEVVTRDGIGVWVDLSFKVPVSGDVMELDVAKAKNHPWAAAHATKRNPSAGGMVPPSSDNALSWPSVKDIMTHKIKANARGTSNILNRSFTDSPNDACSCWEYEIHFLKTSLFDAGASNM